MIDELIRQYLKPLLKEHQFKKQGSTWNRQHGKIVHVLNVQASPWNSQNTSDFTVNLGFLALPIWEIYENKKLPKIVYKTDCFPRLRIGELLKPPYSNPGDIWWKLSCLADIDPIGNEVKSLIEDIGLPYMDKVTDLSDIERIIREDRSLWQAAGDTIQYAILLALLDNSSEAASLLDSIESKSEYWAPFVREVRGRLAQKFGTPFAQP